MSGNELRTNSYTYDEKHRLVSTTYGETKHTYKPIYEKDSRGIDYPDDTVIGVTLDGKFTDITTRDNLNRLSQRTLTVNGNDLLSEEITYRESLQNCCVTSDMVSNVRICVGGTTTDTEYWYDEYGDMIGIEENGRFTSTYLYDKWHRLIKENNRAFDATYVWEYDEGGNILSKKTYEYDSQKPEDLRRIDSYTYEDSDNRDRLTCFNAQPISYDKLGNPIYYKGNSLEWTKARKLAKFGDNTFEYNAEGLRIKKNNKTYVLDGDKILSETDYNGTITYYYGNSGVIGFNYDGTDYYYRKNILGDVLEIYTANGVKVASYAYDAWGNHKIYDIYGDEVTDDSHIGYINPIRYRGYYYDVETGLYYLQTRYYDPETGRFINADAIDYLMPKQVTGLNIYSYCINNPIFGIDSNGTTTKSVGFSFSLAGLGAGYSFSIFLSFDSDDMCALQYSYSVPNNEKTRNTELGVNIGASFFVQHNDEETVSDLEGKSKAVGGAVGIIGADIIKNKNNDNIGNQASIGIGLSASAHVNETYTGTIGSPFSSFIKWVKGWFS